MAHSKTVDRVKRILKAFFDARSMKPPPDAVRMWLDAFSDLPVEAIEAAIRRFNRECSDFPTAAAVRKYAGASALDDEQRAVAAWRVVRSSIRNYGTYYSIEFDDPIIHAAIHGIGGWAHLCRTPHDEMQWKAKSFVAEYMSVARTGLGDFSAIHGILDVSPNAEVPTGLLPHPEFKRLTTEQESRESAISIPHLSAERAL